MMDKQKIRAEFLRKRKGFTYPLGLLANIFSHTEEFINSLSAIDNIAGYYPIGEELDILPLLKKLKSQYQILLPRIAEDLTMNFLPWNGALEKNPTYRFYQPRGGRAVEPNIMIIPAVTCDIKGYRLGYGKGCYDRYLLGKRDIIKITLIPEDLMYRGELPNEAHDLKLDYIITESGVTHVKQQS